MTRRTIAVVLACASALLALPGSAMACSQDDTAWFEGFLDTSCTSSTTNTQLDVLGGLRLQTNGSPVSVPAWDTDGDFDLGVTFGGQTFPPVDFRTLATTGTGTAAALELSDSPVAFTRDTAPTSTLSPTPATAPDNDNVDDPSAVKVGSTYVMYYSGTAEDGSGPAIFRATSNDGRAWTKQDADTGDGDFDPVLRGSLGSFDGRGVYGPDVVYDASDATAPYRMWYSGRDDVFSRVGYATSTDGINWTKYDDDDADTDPDFVLDHGRAGARDSFAAAQPSVLKDGATWKMWYEGDDSNQKSIAYATSADGTTWSKGGAVIVPGSGNVEFGAFAPTVWKDGSDYNMLLAVRKDVGSGVFQTKMQQASSSDGVSWTVGSVVLNEASSRFDAADFNSPDILEDPGAGSSAFKLYYSGSRVDALSGGKHFRIGLSQTSNGSGWQGGKFDGSGAFDSVLDIGALGTAFDSRDVSGLSVVAPPAATTKYVGFYGGVRGQDFIPRLGEATSADGSTWAKVAGSQTGGSLLILGANNDFDEAGQRDPSVLYDLNGNGANDYHLYFTGLTDASPQVRSIGYAGAEENAGTKLPDNTTWTNPTAAALFAADGSGFDANGVSAPSVVKDGTSYFMYYTGHQGSVTKIGRAVSTTTPNGTFTRDANPVIDVGVAGSFDETSVKDPVVTKDPVTAGLWHMTYTGVETLDDGTTRERVGYATSADSGVTWTKQGVVAVPSNSPYSFDEAGLRPQGLVFDTATNTLHGWVEGVDRTGRTRGGHVSAPTTVLSGKLENGLATYQLGDPTTSVRDWRTITPALTGTGVELWVSFLQPYSSAGTEYWSAFFPVPTQNLTPAELNFLLTVRGVRWQARLSGPSGNPSLGKVEISHAPVSFFGSGDAVSNEIAAPSGQSIVSWRSLTVDAGLFSPTGGGSGGGTVKVLDGSGATQLASASLATNGETTVDLSSISPSTYPTLRLRLDLTSDGQASPLVRSLKLLYFTNLSAPPPPPPAPVVPPPPPAPVLTLGTTTPVVTFGKQATLTGNLSQGGAPLVGATVGLLEQPLAAPAFSPLPGAATDASGNYTSLVTPQRKTVYKASFPGAASEPTVTVEVNHAVTLKVVRRRGKGTFTGKVGPAHVGKVVTIQQRKSGRWVSFKSAKTGSLSTFRTTAKLSMRAKYQFRARTLADAEHREGISPTAFVDKHKVSLTTKLSGRTITFSGRVSPAHPRKTVLLKQLKGTRFVTIARITLSGSSTFALKKRFAAGTHQFRADMPADTRHFAGQSPVRTITVK